MKIAIKNFGFNNFNKKKLVSLFSVAIFIFVVFISIGFSAFNNYLSVTNISGEVKLETDVRVTNFFTSNTNSGGVALNTDFNISNVYGDIVLPNIDSTITYEIEVTNLGNTKVGIANITGLNSNLKYTLTDYSLGEAISENGEYTLDVSKKFYITIGYADGITSTSDTQSFNLDIDFQPFYSVTYNGVPGTNHPSEVLGNTNLTITTTLQSIDRLKVTMDNVMLAQGSDYTYNTTSKQLTINSVAGNLVLEYQDKTYLTDLSSSTAYFKESAYKTTITNVSFVDYIDTTNAVTTYDLSENKDNSIIGWIIDNGDSTYNLYIGSIYDIYSKTLNSAFDSMTGMETISFGNLNTSETATTKHMFRESINLENIELGNFNTSNVTNMNSMFYNCSSLTSLDLSSFNTENVTNMGQMFNGCSSLISLDLSGFNTENVTNMYAMFKDCENITSLDLSSFNTSKVTSIAQMFQSCSSLTTLDLSSFNTSKATSMIQMFYNCSSLTSLDLSSFNTENVTIMDGMFQFGNFSELLDISSFNTSNVTSMAAMFMGSKIKTLDLSNFNTSNVTIMDSMFQTTHNLVSLNVSSFNTSQVKSMKKMFYGAVAVSSLDLTNFNTSNVTNMEAMFKLTNLQNLDLSSFDTSKVTNMREMFYGVEELINLDLRTATFSVVEDATDMFTGTLSTIKVIVKDADTKTWIQDKLGEGKGTVVMVSELQ